MLTVVVPKKTNKATCYTPGCSNEVAWSETKKKWTQLCMHHLSLHRDRCAKTNYKKKLVLEKKNQAHITLKRQHEELRRNYEKLLKKYALLKQNVNDTRSSKKKSRQ